MMIPDDTAHQRSSWKILTEFSITVQADYEVLVGDCTSAAEKSVRELHAPASLQARLREALSTALSDAIERQAQSQPGSHILIRLWMMEGSMAALRTRNKADETLSTSGESETVIGGRNSVPGWSFFIVERAGGGGVVGGAANGGEGSSEAPGSVDVYLYLEGDIEGQKG